MSKQSILAELEKQTQDAILNATIMHDDMTNTDDFLAAFLPDVKNRINIIFANMHTRLTAFTHVAK